MSVQVHTQISFKVFAHSQNLWPRAIPQNPTNILHNWLHKIITCSPIIVVTVKKRVLTLTILFSILLTIYLLPQSSFGRNWLLNKTQNILLDSGYNLDFAKSKGNPWLGINLEKASLQGQGIDLVLEQLKVSYFLPALLKGKLPLSLALKEVQGNLSLSELVGNNSGGATKGIKPVLKKLDIDGLTLSVDNVPYEFPNFNLSEVEFLGEDSKVRALLTTSEGQSNFEANLVSLNPLLGQIDFWDTDLRLVRQWYSDLETGKANGTVWLEPEGIKAKAEIKQISTSIIGIAITDVQGEVNYNDSILLANVKGQALGAEVTGQYSANISKKRWQGKIQGSPQLAKAFTWLNNQKWLPFSQSFLNAQGEVDVALNLSGWNYIDLKGKAVGKGELLRKDLDNLAVDIAYHTHKGPDVHVAADIAGGNFEVDINEEDSLIITGKARSLRWWEADIITTADMHLEQNQEGLVGEVVTHFDSNTLERKAEVELTATPKEGLWTLNVNGTDSLGATINAKGTFRGDDLSTELNIIDFYIPYLNEPLTAKVKAKGLYYDLPLELALSTKSPLSLSFLEEVVDVGMVGEAKATLKNAQDFVNIETNFGDFSAKGDLNFSQKLGKMNYQLSSLPFKAPFTGTLQGEGVLKLDDLWSSTANFSSGELMFSTLQFTNPKAEFSWQQNQPINFQGAANNLVFKIIGDDLAAHLQDFPLAFAEKDLSLEGDVFASLPTWQETLNFELKGEAENSFISLQGDLDEAVTKLSLQSGFEIASVQLHENVDFDGTVNLMAKSAELIGKTPQNNANVNLQFKEEKLFLKAKLNDNLDIQGNGSPSDLTNWPWHFSGSVAPEKVVSLFGIGTNITGNLQGDMRVTTLEGKADFDGDALFTGKAWGLGVNGNLTGQGNSILAKLKGKFLGKDVRLEGQVFPSFDSQVYLGNIAEVGLKGNYDELQLNGEGFIDLFKATNSKFNGLVLPAQPYSVSSSIKDRYADISVGNSQLHVSWLDSWQISGQIRQVANWENFNQSIVLELNADVYAGQDLPKGNFQGSLSVDGNPLSLNGSLDNLNLAGSLPIKHYINNLSLPLKVAEQISLTAQIQPLDLGYQIEGDLDPHTLNLSGKGNEALLNLNTDGLIASYEFGSGSLHFQANNFALHEHLIAEDLQGVTITISGDLGYQQSTNLWQGSANVFTTVSDFNTAWQFSGKDSGLFVSANPEISGFETSITGQIMPEFGLELTSKNKQVELSGNITGELTKPQFQGNLVSKEFNQSSVYLPSQTVQVKASWQDGLLVQATNEATNITLANNNWAGEFSLPFLLKGETHHLSGKLQGNFANPKFIGAAAGNIVTANNVIIDRDSVQSDFALNSNAFTTLNSELQGEITLKGQDWQGYATTTVNYNENLVPLRLEAVGSLQNSEINGSLKLGEDTIAVSTQDDGQNLSLSAYLNDFDLAYLQDFVPIESEITGLASGQITLLSFQNGCTTSFKTLISCLDFDITANPRGQVLGQTFNANLQANAKTGFQLQGSVGEISLTAQGNSWQNFNLGLANPEFNDLGVITVELGAEGFWARANYKNQSATLLLQGNEEAFTWNVTLAETKLVGIASKQAYGYNWQSTLSGQSFLGLDDFQAHGNFQAGNVQISSLEATGIDSNLSLNGSLFPQTLLTGSFHHSALPEVTTLTLSREANAQLQGENLSGQSWKGHATTNINYNGVSVPLKLEANGSLQSSKVSGILQLDSEIITFTTQDNDQGLSLSAYLNDFNLTYLQDFVPVETQITGLASGQITLLSLQDACTTNFKSLVDCLDFDINANPQGRVLGQAFNVNLQANAQTGFQLQGSVGDILLNAQGNSWKNFNLGLDNPELNELGVITVDLGAEGLLARANYKNQPATLLLQNKEEGFTWNVTLAETQLAGTANKQDYGYSWQSTLSGQAFLGFDKFQAYGSVQEANVQVSSLEATGIDSNLSLNGSIFPRTLLTGSFWHSSLPEVTTLTINREASSFAISALQQEMQLQTHLEGLDMRELKLNGSMSLASFNISSNLTWQPLEGYTGTAQLSTLLESLALQIAVTGNGGLSGLGSINHNNLPIASLNLQGTKELSSQLSGYVSLDVPFESISDIPAGYARLKGDLTLSPTALTNVADINLLGDIDLEGMISAKGNLKVNLQGGEFTFADSALNLTGNFNREGWGVQGEVLEVNLKPVIATYWEDLVIGEVWGRGHVNASQLWQGAPNIHLSDLTLRSANSYLQGEVVYPSQNQQPIITTMPRDDLLATNIKSSNAPTSNLSFDISIADFTQYGGQLTGTMQLTGLEIVNGTMNATDLSLNQNWQVSLESTLAGHIPDTINANTRGTIKLLGQEHNFSGPLSFTEGSFRGNQNIHSPILVTPLSVSGDFWPLKVNISHGTDNLHINLQSNVLSGSGELSTTVYGLPLTVSASPESDFKLNTEIIGMTLTTQLPRQLSELKALPQKGLILANDLARISIDQNGANITGVSSTSYADISLAGNLQWVNGLNGLISGELTPKQNQIAYIPLSTLPFSIAVNNQQLSFNGENDLGKVQGNFDLVASSGNLIANLEFASGNADVNLAYQRSIGPTGQIKVNNMPLISSDSPLMLSGQVGVTSRGLQGTGELSFFEGRAGLSGELGWAKLSPQLTKFLPTAGNELSLQMDLNNFAVAGIPQLHKHLPFVDALLAGSVYFNDKIITGQITSTASVFEQTFPLQMSLSGNLNHINAQVNLNNNSTAELQYTPTQQELTGRVNFEYFPFETLLEAVFGKANLSAQLTGGANFVIPFKTPRQSKIIFASEQIILEESALSNLRNVGNINARFEAGKLHIEQANFRNINVDTLTNVGSWQASGQVSTEELNLEIRADEADFSPFLQLLPMFTGVDIAAKGSLAVKSIGNLSEPRILLSVPQLDIDLAGNQYQLTGASFGLSDSQLTGTASLTGLSALQGTLKVDSEGQLNLLNPFANSIAFNFAGDIDVPVLGQVKGFMGKIYHDQGWQLSSSGQLGETFELKGKLIPLELDLTGNNLLLKAERFFVGESRANVDLKMVKQVQDYVLSGKIFAHEATLVPRPKIAKTPTPDYYQRIRFNNIHLEAPRDLRFSESFGDAELALDLLLAGNAAESTLQGEINLVQGLFRYSGQDFNLLEGKLDFKSRSGVFPKLTAKAYSSYDKARLGRNVEFFDPKNQYYFDVYVDLEGSWEYSPSEDIYQFKLASDKLNLSSNAVINSEGQARILNEDELASLITLGRPSFGDNIIAEQGLGAAVGYSAIDTAVDLLLVSELQKAISESLGVPSVEIRTTALSTLLSSNGSSSDGPFGFSVSLGGYLDDNLFASYSLGHYNNPDFALSNTFELRYNLADIFASLRSEISFEDESFNDAFAKVGLSVDYQFTPTISFQTSFDFSTEEQGAGFGVNFRW